MLGVGTIFILAFPVCFLFLFFVCFDRILIPVRMHCSLKLICCLYLYFFLYISIQMTMNYYEVVRTDFSPFMAAGLIVVLLGIIMYKVH